MVVFKYQGCVDRREANTREAVLAVSCIGY
jgi:hypothetical protein